MNTETKSKLWVVVSCIVLAWILIQVTMWTSSESTFHGAVIVVGMLAFIAIIAGLGLVVVKTLLDTGGGVAINPTSFALAVGVPISVAVLARSLNVPMGPTVSLALASLGAVAIAINAPQAFPAIGRLIFAGMTVMVICSVVAKLGNGQEGVLFPFTWATDQVIAVMLTALGSTLWTSRNTRRMSIAALVMLTLLFGKYIAIGTYETMEAMFPAAIDAFADKTSFRFDRNTVVIDAPFILVDENGKMTEFQENQKGVAHFNNDPSAEIASKFAGKVAAFVILIDEKTGMRISQEMEGWVLKDKIRSSPTPKSVVVDGPLNADTRSHGEATEFTCKDYEYEVFMRPGERNCGDWEPGMIYRAPNEDLKPRFSTVTGKPLRDGENSTEDVCFVAGSHGAHFCLS